MHAAKRIRAYIENGEDPEQVQVLKTLTTALGLNQSFELGQLYKIDMKYFETAIDLLHDWRFDHHIASRSKLLERLYGEFQFDNPPSND